MRELMLFIHVFIAFLFHSQVSWIRKRDYHLLTVSLTTYSSDERFSVSHAKHSEVRRIVHFNLSLYLIKVNRSPINRIGHFKHESKSIHSNAFNRNIFVFSRFSLSQDWSLQIKYVQLRDAGLYECQVSVHPSTSIFIHLSVVGK